MSTDIAQINDEIIEEKVKNLVEHSEDREDTLQKIAELLADQFDNFDFTLLILTVNVNLYWVLLLGSQRSTPGFLLAREFVDRPLKPMKLLWYRMYRKQKTIWHAVLRLKLKL